MRLSITYFVVASAMAHTALVAVWAMAPSHRLVIPASLASAPTLHIALQETHSVTNHSSVRHTHYYTIRPKQHRLLVPTHLAKTRVKPLTHSMSPPPKPSTTVAQVYQAELRRSEIRNRVLSRIRTDLQQYFVYPLLAQRQGWQGRVLLGFSVAADGNIHNIHVASGSGHSILDTSAVSALAHIHQLYETRGWLQGKPLELQLPVVFRLQGG